MEFGGFNIAIVPPLGSSTHVLRSSNDRGGCIAFIVFYALYSSEPFRRHCHNVYPSVPIYILESMPFVCYHEGGGTHLV